MASELTGSTIKFSRRVIASLTVNRYLDDVSYDLVGLDFSFEVGDSYFLSVVYTHKFLKLFL